MKYLKIKTIQQYQEYLAEYESFKNEKEDKREEIELLEVLIHEYEQRERGSFQSSLNPVELLRFMLDNKGISQNQFSEEINISKQLLSDILNYRRNISKKLVLKLSTYFKLPQEAFSKKYNLQKNNTQMKEAKLLHKKGKLIEKHDLTKIDGIDEKVQNALNKANIFTYEDLSNTSENSINSIVNEAEVGYGLDAYSIKSQSDYALNKLDNLSYSKDDNFKNKITENMSLKDRIKHNLELITNPNTLNEILDFIKPYTTISNTSEGNIKAVLAHAGVFSNEDANNFLDTINSEFNKIDDEW